MNKFKAYRNYITWKDKKGNYNTECNRASLENGIALTIPTSDLTKVALKSSGGGLLNEKEKEMRIRKLVPVETTKLMGFTKTDYQAMRDVNLSDAQIYHCCGDSIVVSVLMAIFGQMLFSDEELKKKLENYIEIVKE